MKKYSLLLVGLLFSLLVMSQKASIAFDVKTHDFGRIKEEDGRVTYIFSFVNNGKGPLVVSRVQSSCGCTTPVWTKTPIEPGKKGTITVTYNPLGRPGKFFKPVSVYSNATDELVNLSIQGEVIPKQSGEDSTYPVSIGGLGLKAKVVSIGNVERGRMQTRVLGIQNIGKTALKPTIENLPVYLTATVLPEVLNPDEEGKITFTLNSKNCNQWGPLSDDVYLSLNGVRKFTDETRILVAANIVEDFSKLTLEQRRKSPVIELPEREIDLGTLREGSKRTGKLKLLNKGLSTLEIRRIINNNKELSIKTSKNSVSINKKTDIVISLNTKNLSEADYKKSFTIQTNDPENAFLIVVVSWKVQK